MYTMRRTVLSDDPNDYIFRFKGRDVGRCYLGRFTDGDRWRWTIYGTNFGTLELTLDDAKAKFKEKFEAP
jgi:hypothetical protein